MCRLQLLPHCPRRPALVAHGLKALKWCSSLGWWAACLPFPSNPAVSAGFEKKNLHLKDIKVCDFVRGMWGEEVG